MFAKLSESEITLRSLLVNGARNSRDVLAAMAAHEFTPKQARRARERQGIVVRRMGNGAAMHSVWELPDPNNAGSQVEGIRAHRTTSGTRRRPRPARPAEGVPPSYPVERSGDQRNGPACATLTDAECTRLEARIDVFTQRGLDLNGARELAAELVERDRSDKRATGSCIECQAFVRRDCPVVPRPPAEIHQCWYLRKDTP